MCRDCYRYRQQRHPERARRTRPDGPGLFDMIRARTDHPTGRPAPAPSLFDLPDPLRPDDRPLAAWSDEDLQKVLESWR